MDRGTGIGKEASIQWFLYGNVAVLFFKITSTPYYGEIFHTLKWGE